MGAAEFARQLRDLGYQVTELPGGAVTFPYDVPVGSLAGTTITLGFIVQPDFPVTPPGGPCVRPALGHPAGNVSVMAQLGMDWEYWSRPFPDWPGSGRSVRAYMAHVRHLFSQR
jgi:hypothetical protein